jgi:hypothetical protein
MTVLSGFDPKRLSQPDTSVRAMSLISGDMTSGPYEQGYDAGQKATEDRIKSLLNGLSPRERAKVIREERRRLSKEIADLGKKDDRLKSLLAAMRDMRSWCDPPFMFKAIESPNLHHLRQAIADGEALDSGDLDGLGRGFDPDFFQDAESFVVQHDWAAAFSKAAGIEGSFRLPFDLCAFEFCINGRRIIALAGNYAELIGDEQSNEVFMQLAILTTPGWTITKHAYWYRSECWDVEAAGYERSRDPFAGVVAAVGAQVKAVCIALDAEVASTGVVRAPHALNKSREKAGRSPVKDHHVVMLSRRNRHPKFDSAVDGGKKRMHFRRGHWRHYPSHKTWIKWTLVGDPDLGFVDKHYRM